jgi:hypothetical protein
VTKALLLRYRVALHARVRVWECCAGRGAMARVIQEHLPQSRIVCSDIVPAPATETQGFTVAQLDALQGNILTPINFADAVISNPPFDIAPSLIRRLGSMGASRKAPLFMALLLKGTFWHAVTRHPLFRECPPTAVHPLLWRPDFEGQGRPTMELAWNVWNPVSAGGPPTHYEPLPHPSGIAGRATRALRVKLSAA